MGSEGQEASEVKGGGSWGRRVGKWASIFVFVAVVICVVAWGVINGFLNSDAGRQFFALRVAKAVGSPLEYERAVVWPWGMVRLTGVQMAVSEEEDELPPFVSSRSLEVKVDLVSLLGRQVKVERVALVDPVFSVVRNAEGKLVLPPVFRERPAAISLPDTGSLGGLAGGESILGGDDAAAGEEEEEILGMRDEDTVEEKKDRDDPGEKEGVEGERDDGVAKTAATKEAGAGVPQGAGEGDGKDGVESDGDASGVAGEGDGGKPRERSPLVIRHGARDYFFGDFEIKQGTFQVLSFDDRPLLEVRDVELSVGMGGFPPEGGEFSAASAILFGEIEVENLRSPIVTDGIVVGLPGFECDFRGGRVEGRVEASLLATGMPFLVGVQFQEIPMQVASELFGGRVTFSEGAMEGRMQMLGLLRAPATYRGRGEARVSGARLEKNRLLGRTGPEAGVKSLQGFEFEDMSLRFAVLQGQVLVEELSVVSPDLSVSARGYVGLGGALNLAARVYVSERVHNGAKALEDRMRGTGTLGFKAFEGGSRFYRDYLVRGEVWEPTIDFLAGGAQMGVAGIQEVLLRLSAPEGDGRGVQGSE